MNAVGSIRASLLLRCSVLKSVVLLADSSSICLSPSLSLSLALYSAQSEEGNKQRLMEAFSQLMQNIPLGAERIHRIRFRDNFDKFIVNVRGFLFVK